jgi:hypothetical protein
MKLLSETVKKFPLPLKIVLCSLLTLLFSGFLTSNAQATPLQQVTITINYASPSWVNDYRFSFGIYQDSVNSGTYTIPSSGLSSYPYFGGDRVSSAGPTSGTITTTLEIPALAANPTNIYFELFGRYYGPGIPHDGYPHDNPPDRFGYFNAIPPYDGVSLSAIESQIYANGLVLISLADVYSGSKVSGIIDYVFGYGEANLNLGTWEVDPVTEVDPVPEPSSLLLLGAGLMGFCGLLAWRRRGEAGTYTLAA